MTNKKSIISTGIASVLLVSAAGFGVTALTGCSDEPKEEETVQVEETENIANENEAVEEVEESEDELMSKVKISKCETFIDKYNREGIKFTITNNSDKLITKVRYILWAAPTEIDGYGDPHVGKPVTIKSYGPNHSMLPMGEDVDEDVIGNLEPGESREITFYGNQTLNKTVREFLDSGERVSDQLRFATDFYSDPSVEIMEVSTEPRDFTTTHPHDTIFSGDLSSGSVNIEIKDVPSDDENRVAANLVFKNNTDWYWEELEAVLLVVDDDGIPITTDFLCEWLNNYQYLLAKPHGEQSKSDFSLPLSTGASKRITDAGHIKLYSMRGHVDVEKTREVIPDFYPEELEPGGKVIGGR